MNTQTFISLFNKGNRKDKSQLLLDNLRDVEASQHLVIDMKGGPYESFNILAFAAKRLGYWYAKTITGDMIPMTAFRLHPSGEKTFSEWAVQVPINFADAHRAMFIQSFENLVLPEHAAN
jgi:hypothetical protein